MTKNKTHELPTTLPASQYITVHGIKEDGSCTCRLGSVCDKPGKHSKGSWKPTETVLIKYNAAFRTGFCTKTKKHYFTLDIDSKGNEELLQKCLEKYHVSLQDTFSLKTQSGGYHLIFTSPVAIKTCVSLSKKEYPVDFRGQGGYSIVAGHGTKGSYVVVNDMEPTEVSPLTLSTIKEEGGLLKNKGLVKVKTPTPVPLPPSPTYIVSLPTNVHTPPVTKSSHSVKEVIDRIRANDSSLIIGEGSRHDMLVRIAIALRNYEQLETAAIQSFLGYAVSFCENAETVASEELISIAAWAGNKEPKGYMKKEIKSWKYDMVLFSNISSDTKWVPVADIEALYRDLLDYDRGTEPGTWGKLPHGVMAAKLSGYKTKIGTKRRVACYAIDLNEFKKNIEGVKMLIDAERKNKKELIEQVKRITSRKPPMPPELDITIPATCPPAEDVDFDKLVEEYNKARDEVRLGAKEVSLLSLINSI